MKIELSIAMTLFTCHTAISQTTGVSNDSLNAKQKNSIPLKVTIKTDALTMIGNAVEKDNPQLIFSSEVQYNKKYSLQLNIGFFYSDLPHYHSGKFEIGPEFRWLIDSKDGSAFHLGTYFYYSYNDLRYFLYEPYRTIPIHDIEKTFEAGVGGGYRLQFLKHFVIDPSIYIGHPYTTILRSNQTKIYNINSEENINVRILLLVGVCF